MTSHKSEKARAAANAAEETSGSPSIGKLPKSLLDAWLLLLVKTWSGHGYALVDMLTKLGFASVDHTRVYRELRSLEQQGLVQSVWDFASNGPAKRVYKLTKAGDEFLSGSAQVMEGYFKMVTAFTNMYTGALGSLGDFQSVLNTKKD